LEVKTEMHDVALKRRIAALFVAALLAMSGAALTSAVLATDAQAAIAQECNITVE
jgi:hypothetical protein